MAKYKARSVKNGWGDLMYIIVTNQPDDWNWKERNWPAIAKFEIAAGYGKDDQSRRALEYADYLNKTETKRPPIGE